MNLTALKQIVNIDNQSCIFLSLRKSMIQLIYQEKNIDLIKLRFFLMSE